MVVDGGEMEAQMYLQISVQQIVGRPLVNLPLRLHFKVIAEAVDLVDKHLELDTRIDLVRLGHGLVQLLQGVLELVLYVNDKDYTSALAENHVRIEVWIKIINLAREIPDLELDKAVVVNVVLDDLVGRLQE